MVGAKPEAPFFDVEDQFMQDAGRRCNHTPAPVYARSSCSAIDVTFVRSMRVSTPSASGFRFRPSTLVCTLDERRVSIWCSRYTLQSVQRHLPRSGQTVACAMHLPIVGWVSHARIRRATREADSGEPKNSDFVFLVPGNDADSNDTTMYCPKRYVQRA